MSNNPLMAYKPHEKVFVKLPTEGKFYDQTVLSVKGDSELGVLPMSAVDEMVFSNPDALMNGRAVTQVIQNCVPGVKDASKLAVSDVEALLLAIKLASNEETYDVNTKCPSCNKEGSFERDIDYLISTVSFMDDEYKFELESGVKIMLCPNTWASHSKLQQIAFKQQRLMQVSKNPNLSDTDKQQIFNEMFEQMISLNIDLVVDCVYYIETPDGNQVNNPKHVGEFIATLSKSELASLSEIIEGINDTGISHVLPVSCPHCEHEWDLEGLRFDPSYFFE